MSPTPAPAPELVALLDAFRNAAQDYAFTRYTDDDAGRELVQARERLDARLAAVCADAALGTALRAALATLTPGFDLLIDCPSPDEDVLRQVYVGSPSLSVRQNDATRALTSLLAAAPPIEADP